MITINDEFDFNPGMYCAFNEYNFYKLIEFEHPCDNPYEPCDNYNELIEKIYSGKSFRIDTTTPIENWCFLIYDDYNTFVSTRTECEQGFGPYSGREFEFYKEKEIK